MKKIIIFILLIFSITSCFGEKKLDNNKKVNINDTQEKINNEKVKESGLAKGGFSGTTSVNSDFKK